MILRTFLPLSILLAITFYPFAPAFADEWNDLYTKGLDALREGKWQEASEYFENALAVRPRPEHRALTSSREPVEYLPYFYLGQAHFFAGNFDKAALAFKESESAGAVRQTRQAAYLRAFTKVTNLVLELLAREQPQQMSSAYQDAVGELSVLIISGRYADATQNLAELRSAYPDQALLPAIQQLLDDLHNARQAPKIVQPIPEPNTEARDRFDLGLSYFLQGRYELALQAFREANRLDPNLALASDMIQKTRFEMERLDLPVQTEIRTVTVRPSEPTIVVTPPRKTSDQLYVLSGHVLDDQGVEMVQFTINGRPLLDATATRMVRRPGPEDDPKMFMISAEIPLVMGENEIVVTAVDIDSAARPISRQFIIARVPPFYATLKFQVGAAVALVLLIGFVAVGKYWRHRIAIINKYNPYIAGSPIRNEEMFFGRDRLITRILNTLHNNSLMIYGPRRIGKTSLQHQLRRRLEALQDKEYEFIPVMIDLQGTSEERFFHTLMEEIFEACKPKLNGTLTLLISQEAIEYSSRDFSRDLKMILESLSSQTPKKLKLVLLMDEVDELNKYGEHVNQKLRSVFMKTFAENLVAVMSGAHLRKTWESEGSPWYNFFEEIEVPPFEREDAVHLIKRPVAGIFSYDEQAIDGIIQYSECKPYTIQRFCVNVIHRIIEQKRRRVTIEDVEAVKRAISRSSTER